MRPKISLIVCCIFLLCSCANKNESGKYESNSSASAPPEHSSAVASAPEQGNSKVTGTASNLVGNAASFASNDMKPSMNASAAPEKKVILSGDFSCRVKSVFTSVKELEYLVKSLGGVVQESNMQNTIGDTKTINKKDSITEFHAYTTTASLVLRVPSAKFDSVIHALPGMVEFIDLRVIKENDVSLQYYNNKIREEANAERLAEMKNKSSGPGNGVEIEEYKDRKQDEKINHEVENMGIQGDVSFATITVKLAQPPQVYTKTVMNTETLADGHFGANCIAALGEGIDFLKTIIIGFLTIWPLLFVAAGVILGFKLYRRKYYRPLVK